MRKTKLYGCCFALVTGNSRVIIKAANKFRAAELMRYCGYRLCSDELNDTRNPHELSVMKDSPEGVWFRDLAQAEGEYRPLLPLAKGQGG